MQMTIDSSTVELDDAMREHIERRLRFVFTRYSPQIKRISLSVENADRPSGGCDSWCEISMKLIPAEEVAIEVHAADIRSAVALAVDRAGRAMARRIEQQRRS